MGNQLAQKKLMFAADCHNFELQCLYSGTSSALATVLANFVNSEVAQAVAFSRCTCLRRTTDGTLCEAAFS